MILKIIKLIEIKNRDPIMKKIKKKKSLNKNIYQKNNIPKNKMILYVSCFSY